MKIQHLTKDSIKKYGSILDFEPIQRDVCSDSGSHFRVVAKSPESTGWRIGKYIGRDYKTSKLECHPNTYESFEPISGTGVLLLAEYDTPDNIEAFLLDKPVIVRKNIWHWILTLSEEFHAKVTENLDVETEFHELTMPMGVYVL